MRQAELQARLQAQYLQVPQPPPYDPYAQAEYPLPYTEADYTQAEDPYTEMEQAEALRDLFLSEE